MNEVKYMYGTALRGSNSICLFKQKILGVITYEGKSQFVCDPRAEIVWVYSQKSEAPDQQVGHTYRRNRDPMAFSDLFPSEEIQARINAMISKKLKRSKDYLSFLEGSFEKKVAELRKAIVTQKEKVEQIEQINLENLPQESYISPFTGETH